MLASVCAVLYLLIPKPGYFVVAALSAVNSAKSGYGDRTFLIPLCLRTRICLASMLQSRGWNTKDGEVPGRSQRKYE